MFNLDDGDGVATYPVPGRSPEQNRRIAGHEIGHAYVSKAIGDHLFEVRIIPDRGPNGYEGRCIRSGPPSALTFDDIGQDKTAEIVSICERLERLTPEMGTSRVDSSEFYIRSQNNVIALCAGEVAESILHPDLPSLGAVHDFVEAAAFARVAVVASPAVAALIEYAKQEARAIIENGLPVVHALVEELIVKGKLSGAEVDAIIWRTLNLQSIEAERQRRDDMGRRALNAKQFLEGIKLNG